MNLLRYKDHSEIIAKIPDYFYTALLGELIAINGVGIIGSAKKYGDLDSGTAGWYYALHQTCDKLNLNWIVDYWGALE